MHSVLRGRWYGQSQANNWVAPKIEPANGWLCALDHYLGGWVARPLNRLPHAPLLYCRWTGRGSRANRLQNICHRLSANASFNNVRFWTSDVPSQHFTSVCPYLDPIYGQVDVPVTNYGQVDVPLTDHGHLFSIKHHSVDWRRITQGSNAICYLYRGSKFSTRKHRAKLKAHIQWL